MTGGAILWVICASAALADEDSWKAPLSEKEVIIESNIQRKHNIQGLYPSLVQIPSQGDGGDIYTTNPFADIVHAVCWTSNYLAGLSFKTAQLEKSGAPQDVVNAARARADEVFEAVYRCQRVTGRRGLQARGYLLGRGEVYAERQEGSSKLPFWRQGEVDGRDYRWVGDPSHHNYSDAVHGLMQYYTLAAKGQQQERDPGSSSWGLENPEESTHCWATRSSPEHSMSPRGSGRPAAGLESMPIPIRGS